MFRRVHCMCMCHCMCILNFVQVYETSLCLFGQVSRLQLQYWAWRVLWRCIWKENGIWYTTAGLYPDEHHASRGRRLLWPKDQGELVSQASSTGNSSLQQGVGGTIDTWSFSPSQLIYDFRDGGGSFGLLSLRPEHLPDKDKTKFERIGVKIPSMV